MTELLTATNLEQWSERNDSREHLPTLVRRLILAVAAPETLRMPAAGGVGLPGLDGRSRAHPARRRSRRQRAPSGRWARAATPRARRNATTGSGSTGQPGMSALASPSCS